MKESRFRKWKNSGGSIKGILQQLSSNISKTRISNPVKSVGMKLFLSFFLSIVILVLVVGFLAYNTSKTIIKDKVASSSESAIIQASGKLDAILSQYEQLSLQFFVDPLIIQFMRDIEDDSLDDFEQLEQKQLFQQTITGYGVKDTNLKGVHVIMKSGEILSSASSASVVSGAQESEWYKLAAEAKGQPVWIPTVINGVFDQSNRINAFGLTRRITDTNTGMELATILIEIKYSVFEEELKSLLGNENDGNHIAILDPNNTYVYSSAIDYLTQNSKIKLGDKVSGRDEGLDQFDKDALIAYAKSDLTKWSLVGTFPVETLVEDARTILKQTILVAVGSAVLAIILSFFIVRMIGRPLGTLRRLMKDGEQGNLLVRTNFKNKDEFGELGVSFNQMMEKITELVRQTNTSAHEVLENSVILLDSSKKTALSAKEISVATEEIASGASTLAIEAERGNDLTNHIGLQMRNVVDANLQMGNSAQEVRKVSEQGISYMGELITKTGVTEDKTRMMVEKVDRLKDSTTSIRKILDVLNNLTKQTNILSLNATIEAARAGAAGKGFMVVADEIRKLADQSRQSIDVVAQITETIQTEIDQTVTVLSEAYPIFKEQIVSVKEADQIFKEVHKNMGGFIQQLDTVTESIQQLEQSQHTLSEAMSSVSAVSQQSSATSEEVASLSTEQLNVSQGLVSLAERLEALSNSLKGTISKFTV